MLSKDQRQQFCGCEVPFLCMIPSATDRTLEHKWMEAHYSKRRFIPHFKPFFLFFVLPVSVYVSRNDTLRFDSPRQIMASENSCR